MVEFNYERVRAWALSTPRKRANQAFTAGVERDIAYLIEDLTDALKTDDLRTDTVVSREQYDKVLAAARGMEKALENLLSTVCNMKNPQNIADVALMVLKFRGPIEYSKQALAAFEQLEKEGV